MAVLTNPAFIDENDKLCIKPFHQHDCPECPKNLCKTKAVRELLQENLHSYKKIYYSGDGLNDFCPIV